MQCQLDDIAKLKQIKAVRKALNNLPSGINKTYERILARVPHGNFNVVHRALLWLSFNILPLLLEELAEAIAIEKGLLDIDEDALLSSPEDLLDMCSSLVIISESRDEVTLAHLSVKDYLLSTAIRDSDARKFALSRESANKEISLSCLTYLSYSEFRTGPVETQKAWCNRSERYPLLQYVTVAWPYHFNAAGQPQDLNAKIAQFLTDSSRCLFLSWVQSPKLGSLPTPYAPTLLRRLLWTRQDGTGAGRRRRRSGCAGESLWWHDTPCGCVEETPRRDEDFAGGRCGS